jgi:hypothetical protein
MQISQRLEEIVKIKYLDAPHVPIWFSMIFDIHSAYLGQNNTSINKHTLFLHVSIASTGYVPYKSTL